MWRLLHVSFTGRSTFEPGEPGSSSKRSGLLSPAAGAAEIERKTVPLLAPLARDLRAGGVQLALVRRGGQIDLETQRLLLAANGVNRYPQRLLIGTVEFAGQLAVRRLRQAQRHTKLRRSGIKHALPELLVRRRLFGSVLRVHLRSGKRLEHLFSDERRTSNLRQARGVKLFRHAFRHELSDHFIYAREDEEVAGVRNDDLTAVGKMSRRRLSQPRRRNGIGLARDQQHRRL